MEGDGKLQKVVSKTESEQNEDEERKHFCKVIGAFRFYRVHSLRRNALSEKYFRDLPKRHQQLLPGFCEHLSTIQTCIEHNYEIIKLLIADTDNMFENRLDYYDANGAICSASAFDMDKVRSILKQIVRDWSKEGEGERASCYEPVISAIRRFFPPDQCNVSEVSVLVPGAGLGRLAYEIARLGYTCQGNEFSLFMLFASNFILNKCRDVDTYTVYPWVHQYCNNMSYTDQVRPAHFPDVSPADMPPDSNFSMAAGDFLEVYEDPASWDCVATVFFIDTAHNIVAYIETIWKILKPNGYWINFGPLLYHFADMPNESSIELPYDELRRLIISLNFEILEERTGLPARYTQNPRSMLRYEYDCVFFVARKIVPPTS